MPANCHRLVPVAELRQAPSNTISTATTSSRRPALRGDLGPSIGAAKSVGGLHISLMQKGARPTRLFQRCAHPRPLPERLELDWRSPCGSKDGIKLLFCPGI